MWNSLYVFYFIYWIESLPSPFSLATHIFPQKVTMMPVKLRRILFFKVLYYHVVPLLYILFDRQNHPAKQNLVPKAFNTCILVNKISCRPFFIDVSIFMQAFVEKTQNFPLRTGFLTNIQHQTHNLYRFINIFCGGCNYEISQDFNNYLIFIIIDIQNMLFSSPDLVLILSVMVHVLDKHFCNGHFFFNPNHILTVM